MNLEFLILPSLSQILSADVATGLHARYTYSSGSTDSLNGKWTMVIIFATKKLMP